jgi:hypothetical protein
VRELSGFDGDQSFYERPPRVASTHPRVVKPDIRGYRCANVRKATCSRLTNVNARTAAKAESKPSPFSLLYVAAKLRIGLKSPKLALLAVSLVLGTGAACVEKLT